MVRAQLSRNRLASRLIPIAGREEAGRRPLYEVGHAMPGEDGGGKVHLPCEKNQDNRQGERARSPEHRDNTQGAASPQTLFQGDVDAGTADACGTGWREARREPHGSRLKKLRALVTSAERLGGLPWRVQLVQGRVVTARLDVTPDAQPMPVVSEWPI